MASVLSQLYFGPWNDINNPPPPGAIPDWYNPHDCDYNNPCFYVTSSSSTQVALSLYARNTSGSDVTGVRIQLLIAGGVIDMSGNVADQLKQKLANATLKHEWPNEIVPAYTWQQDAFWVQSWTIAIPRDYSGRYILFSRLFYDPAHIGPSQSDPSQDPCVGVKIR